MKYEKPEAEVVEFKVLEANAAQGVTLDNYPNSTSVFGTEDYVDRRDP